MARVSWIVGLVIAAAIYPVAAGETKKGAAFDAAKLVGTWEYVSGVKNGEKLGADHFKKQTMIIAKDKLTLKGPDATFVMKYELDAKKSPVGVKLTITESPFGAGMMANGIIEFQGDELVLCYAPMGGDGPKTFEAKEGSQFHLFKLKRAK